jgi:hypothetical protein
VAHAACNLLLLLMLHQVYHVSKQGIKYMCTQQGREVEVSWCLHTCLHAHLLAFTMAVLTLHLALLPSSCGRIAQVPLCWHGVLVALSKNEHGVMA